MSNVAVISSPVLNVTVTSSVTSFASEKRFAKDLTVAALKVNIISGCSWFSALHAQRDMKCTGHADFRIIILLSGLGLLQSRTQSM
jgi:hypothetical protein